MSIQFSAVLTGILFAAVFTVPQKTLAQTTETGSTPQTTVTEIEAIPKPPLHPPYLIHELLYQVNEVNRRLQAGVVVQCRCNNDYWWWAFNEAAETSANDSKDAETSVGDSADDTQSHWSVIPKYKKIVRGYGYNMREAKWDAMQACGPIAVPIEENPPEEGPAGDGGKVTAENGNTDEVGDAVDVENKAFIWCHHSKRFRP